MSPDLAVLHDQFRTMGGAERVACEMARTFDAPILVGAVDDDVPPEDVEVREVFTGRVGQRCMRSHYLVQDLYQMQAWQHVPEAYEFDTLIINKTNPGWFIPRDDQTTIWYLHSTPRGLYDQWHRQGGHWLTRLIKTPMRPLYAPQTRMADAWACNSDLVQRRLDRYWDVEPSDVSVIYPPVRVDEYGPELAGDRIGDYYLTVSRLRDHKRVDDIIRAFNRLYETDGLRLLIAGDGPERDHLEDLAGPGVELLGYVDESEKRALMAGAEAFVMAAENEDFGLTPIESYASGTPVIGVRDGFTEQQVLDGESGYLFAHQGGHLRETVRLFDREGVAWSADELQAFAERFSAERFRSELRTVVEVAQDRRDATIRPDWKEAEPIIEREEPTPAIPDGGDP